MNSLKLFFLTAFCLIATQLAIYGQTLANELAVSSLYIKMFDERPILVSLNNQNITKAQTNIVIDGIKPGKYLLSVSEPTIYYKTKIPNSLKTPHTRIIVSKYIEVPVHTIIFSLIDDNNNLQREFGDLLSKL